MGNRNFCDVVALQEKEWQREQEQKRKKRERGEDTDDDDDQYVINTSDEDELPFACFICRDEFVKPVVTK